LPESGSVSPPNDSAVAGAHQSQAGIASPTRNLLARHPSGRSSGRRFYRAAADGAAANRATPCGASPRNECPGPTGTGSAGTRGEADR